MPRFRPIKGPSAETVDTRFTPVILNSDVTRQTSLWAGLRIAQARASSLTRERSRLAHKHGQASPELARIDAVLRTHAHLVAAFTSEVERCRIALPKVPEGGAVVHGRVGAAKGGAVPGLVVSLLDERSRPVARGKTDAIGYFKLDLGAEAAGAARPTPARRPTSAKRAVPAEPPPVPAGATQPAVGRNLRLVIARGEEELHRREIASPEPGQIKYIEIVVPA